MILLFAYVLACVSAVNQQTVKDNLQEITYSGSLSRYIRIMKGDFWVCELISRISVSLPCTDMVSLQEFGLS